MQHKTDTKKTLRNNQTEGSISQGIYNAIRKWIMRDIDPVARKLERSLSEVKTLTNKIESLTMKQPPKYAPKRKVLTDDAKLVADSYADYKAELTRLCEDEFAKAIGSRDLLPSHKTNIKLQVSRQIQYDLDELTRTAKDRVKFDAPIKKSRKSLGYTPPRKAPHGWMRGLSETTIEESTEIEHLEDFRSALVKMKHLQDLFLPDYQEQRENPTEVTEDGFKEEEPAVSLDTGLIDSLPVDDSIQIKDPQMTQDYDYIIPEENWDGNA